MRGAVVLLAACLLAALAAGCGSSSGGAFEPAGSQGGVRPSGGAGNGGTDPNAGAEVVEVAPGLTLVYEDPLPSDPVHAEIMRGVRAYLLAKYRGIATGGKDTSYRDVTTEEGGFTLREGIDSYVGKGVTVKGPVHVHRARVTSVWKNQGAAVDVCVSEQDAKIINAKTGKARKPKGMKLFWHQGVALRRDGDKWLAASFTNNPSANKECRR